MRAGLIAVFTVAILLILIVGGVSVFYAEENWRGLQEWNNAKAEIESHGISFDRQALLSQPIPMEQNFAALPLLAIQQSTKYPYSWKSPALDDAIAPIRKKLPSSKEEAERSDYLPFVTSGQEANLDLPLVRERLTNIGKELNPPIPISPTASATEGLETLCPAIAELRRANGNRTFCVFPRCFDRTPPYAPSFGPAISAIGLFRVLSVEEQIALQEHNIPVVIGDFNVGWKLFDGCAQLPYLISGLVACVPIQLQLNVIAHGIHRHAFSLSELEQIECPLHKIDLLKDSQYWIVGDIVDYDLPYSAYYRKHRLISEEEMEVLRGSFISGEAKPTWFTFLVFWLTPSGWFYREEAANARARLLGTLSAFDSQGHRIYPNRIEDTSARMEKQRSWVFWDQSLAGKSQMFDGTLKSLAFAQARLDEALIALRLERYHLRINKYPTSLAELNATLPRDVMSGEDYIYRLLANDQFILYSVGWNQSDDGGAGPKKEEKQQDSADWVWPMAKE